MTYNVTLTPSGCTETSGWHVLYYYLSTNSASYPRHIRFAYDNCAELGAAGVNITSVTVHGYVRNSASAVKRLFMGFRASTNHGVAQWASIGSEMVVDGTFTAIDGWSKSGFGYNRFTRTYSGNHVMVRWMRQQFAAGEPIYLGVVQPDSGKSVSTNCSTGEWTINVTYELLGNIPTTDKTTAKLGETVTTTINHIITDSSTTLNYKIGDTVIATEDIGTATTHTFTIPESAGSAFPNSKTATMSVEAVTSQSGTEYGTLSTSFTVTLPEDASPTASMNVSRVWLDGTATAAQIEAYVQKQSGACASIAGTAKYGASIASVKLSAEGSEYKADSASATLTHLPFSGSGNIVLTATVTDTRGNTGTAAETVNVLPWTSPTIQTFTIQRTTQTGTIALDGTSAKADATASVSSLKISDVEKNVLTFLIQYRGIGETDWASADAITATDITSTISGILTNSGTIIDSFDDMSGYEFRLCATDLYTSSYALDEMPTKEQFWDVDESTGKMGFGGDAPDEDDGYFYRFHEPVDFAGGYKVYSTSETDTGNTWIDYKAIYRTVITTTTTLCNSMGVVATLPSTIETPVSFRAFAKHPDDNGWRPIPSAYHGDSAWDVLVYVEGADVYMGFGSAWTTGTKEIVIIAEYTKVMGDKPVMSNADVISLSRGTCLSLPVTLMSDGEAVTMDASDYLVLTVRKLASSTSPILLQITGENGSNVLTIHEEDTANMEIGKYSAEIRLYHFGCEYSVWGVDSTDASKKNLKNFIVLAEVG